MERPVIRKIELLVHPFYWFDKFYFHFKNGESEFVNYKGNPTIREKKSRELLKHLKRTYSSIVLKAKADKKSIMVLTDMKFDKKFVQEQFDELKEFATRQLEKRLVIVSQDVNEDWSEQDLRKLTKDSSFKLARMLAITASGEYGDHCVRYALNNLRSKLARKSFTIKKARIMKNQGIAYPGEGDRLEHFAGKGKIKKARASRREPNKRKLLFREIFRK